MIFPFFSHKLRFMTVLELVLLLLLRPLLITEDAGVTMTIATFALRSVAFIYSCPSASNHE